MMKSDTTRERNRVTELAKEYAERGFRVTLPKSRDDLPHFLDQFDYLPDLIAQSEKENLIVEVKSNQTQSTLALLSEVAERINAQPHWQFVLVVTNPKRAPLVKVASHPGSPRVLLDKSEALGSKDQTHVEAAFLFAWAALESALRLHRQTGKESRTASTAWTLIRDAATDGWLSLYDARKLETLFKKRNALVHGDTDVWLEVADLQTVKRITTEFLNAAEEDRGLDKQEADPN